MKEDYSDKQLVASRRETFQDGQVGDNLCPDRNKVTFPVENAHYDCERTWIKDKRKAHHVFDVPKMPSLKMLLKGKLRTLKMREKENMTGICDSITAE